MAQQAGERTEKATSRRRQRARDQGQFAYSQELTSAMTLAACVVTAFYSLRSPAGFRAFFAGLLENAATESDSRTIAPENPALLDSMAKIVVPRRGGGTGRVENARRFLGATDHASC